MIDLKKLLKSAFQSEDKRKQQPDIPSRCPLAGRCAKCSDSCPIHKQNNIAKDGGKVRE